MNIISLMILALSNAMFSAGDAGPDRQGAFAAPAAVLVPAMPAPDALAVGAAPTTMPTTGPGATIHAQQPPNKINLGIISLGLIVMIFWTLRRLANPRMLLLADTPGRPNTVNVGHIFLIFALYLAMPRIVYVLGGGLAVGEAIGLQVVMFSAGIAVLLAASLMTAWRTFPLGLSRGLGLSMRHWFYDSGRGVLAYLAVVPVCYGLAWLMETLLPEFRKDHILLTIIRDGGWPWNFIAAGLAIIPGPLAEELFFRGLIQSMLRKYLASAWGAILMTSLIFSLMHLGTPLYIPALLVLSIALGYNYERCGRLWPSILMHVAFNAVNILIFITTTPAA
ncbi:MAG: CPBP family intramembrane metalloprotease [Planctomycetes bacterium]|nr:CPBP family intramembrane metalloprotease [Planctomycetota bacterium]